MQESKMLLDETEIRRSIVTLVGEGNLFEVRIIEPNSPFQYSGYFSSSDVLLDKLKRQDLRTSNVYIVLNRIKEQCKGRTQVDCFQKVKTATSDTDIENREWLLIDLDPKRPKDTSATNEQVEYSRQRLEVVYQYLKDQGFEEPIMAFSGNGYHLLYKVHLDNSEENKEIIAKFLHTLDVYFSDDKVEIDRTVSNASRICKLYGTFARKGRDIPEQPHRLSKILKMPTSIQPVSKKYIQKITDSFVEERPQPDRYNNYNASEFNIEEWLKKYNLNYRVSTWKDGTKYILDCCPFDSNHKGKDAAIFKMHNGNLGFKCFHNSCSDRSWKDVRLLFEPEAYSRKWDNQKRIQYRPNKEQRRVEPIVEQENKPVFLTAMDVYKAPKPPQSFVKTGIREIDTRLRGLMKGHVSVWSGLRGSAKSTLLSEIVLNAVNDGCTAIVYSGELSSDNFMRWMNQQAAGHHNEPSAYQGYFNTPKQIKESIAKWLGKKLYLYNNDYGNNFEAVAEKLEKQIKETSADIVMLDNLMSFNIVSLADSKWDAQSAFVWKLHDMSRKYNTHICFVAHPKKAQGFLRFDDISGTADLGNATDDAFIVHRVNEDFKRLSAQMFRWKSDTPIYQSTNCVEIVKDREGGNQDVFIPLYYEVRSKRLLNSPDEYIVYGWEDIEQAQKEKPNNNKPVEIIPSYDNSEWAEIPEGDDIGF